MTEYVPTQKGATIRYPSTAYLTLDSRDRTSGETVFDISIQKKTNVMTGFFTRLALTEVQLNWNIPNINSQLSNNTFTVVIGTTPTTVTLPNGFYTVQQALDAIVFLLNASLGASTFSIQTTSLPFGSVNIAKATGTFSITSTTLSGQLGFLLGATASATQQAVVPDLRPFDYIDFVSSQLTYCQDVKDGTSAPLDLDAMYRLYFNFDGSYTSYDGYGFPILFGYKPDRLLRQIVIPKQIKWDNIQPIGNLTIQLYGRRDLGPFTSPSYDRIQGLAEYGTNYALTFQVSEV
jgi:hypothetical protein